MKYAILSHVSEKVVDYDEMTGLVKMAEQDKLHVRQRDGYQKKKSGVANGPTCARLLISLAGWHEEWRLGGS